MENRAASLGGSLIWCRYPGPYQQVQVQLHDCLVGLLLRLSADGQTLLGLGDLRYYKMPGNVEENGAETSDAASDHDRTEGDSIQPTALHDDEDDEKMDMYHTSPEASGASAPPTKKYDPKDPQRPRRKKARRACFACQRAHLTCGK